MITHEQITVKPLFPLTESLSITIGDSIYPFHPTGELVIPWVSTRTEKGGTRE